MISFALTDEQRLLRETVRKFAQTELREVARACDEASRLPDELLATVADLGLVAGVMPESFGGGGSDRSPVTNTLLAEELGAGDSSLGLAAVAPALFAIPVLEFGTEAQKEQLLPMFSEPGFHAASMALHEAHFGFDAAALRTVAAPAPGGYRLTGSKRFVPLGDRASHILVIARLEESGLEGLEAFVVPRDSKGLECAPEPEKTLGLQALPTAALELDGVEVASEARLGGENGIDGARLINLCRVAGAAFAVGASRTVLEYATAYAKDRLVSGRPIAQKQAIAFMLADMEVEVNAMRHLVWKAASELEQRRDASRMATLASDYVRRKSMEIADKGVQILGGHGYIRDYPMEMWYRNMRALTILDGVGIV
ncbi:acyl-CoA dehydrogenase family protein [Pseudohaliea sp.]|uniref:acyl-CoA dehydrogenase family protein n=1 Tax=Pseudohaliea sp. TaxID=2740289 RepID=UPI0032ED337B